MISDLKMGFKILKFGHGRIANLAGSMIAILLGVFMYGISGVLSGSFPSTLPGGYFFMMAEVFVIQLYYSVNISNMVQASPAKKRLMTSVPTALSTFCILMGYGVTLLCIGVVSCFRPEMLKAACIQIVFTAGVMGVVLIYSGVVYKYFVVGTVLFFAAFLSFYASYSHSETWISGIFGSGWKAFGLTAVSGLAFILICSFLEYLLFLAFYKAPMAKMAQNVSLRRQL